VGPALGAREIALQNRLANTLLAATAFLIAFVALFLFRSFDNNSLFSWAWAFAEVNAAHVYLALAAGLVIAFLLSRPSVPERVHLPLLATLSCAAALPFWTEAELIVDASRYFTQAKHLAMYGVPYFLKEWGRSIPAWTDLPIVPFLYGMVFSAVGEHRIAIQLLTTMLFSLTVVLTYLTGKTLWNSTIGFSAALMLLGIPYLLTQVPLALVDVPTMCFLMLAVYTFLLAIRTGGAARMACSAAAIVLTVLAKYSAWFMLTVLIVVMAVYARDRRSLVRGAAILLIAGTASGCLLLMKFDVVSGQIALLRAYQGPGLAWWGESFVSTFLFQMHPFITLFALLSVAVALLKRDARFAIISWLVLLIVLFGIRRIRYALPVFPMVALMAGYGLQVIKQDDLRRFIAYGIVSTSLVIAIYAYLPLAEHMSAVNLKHAGAYLNTLGVADVEVITLPPKEPLFNHAISVPLLDLFTNKRIHYRYEPGVLPPRGEIERSSLRFAWEYRNPAYYEDTPPGAERSVLVVIADASDSAMPRSLERNGNHYDQARFFCINEAIFKHTVGIGIYQPH
jgi:hypothetical protein